MKVSGPVALLFLIGLAGISWWLANRDRESGAGSGPPLGLKEPGYYLREAVLEQTDERGRIALRVAAEAATEDRARAEVALERLQVEYAPRAGRTWRATAARGAVADAGRRVRLEGDVQLSGAGAAPASGQPVVYTEHLLLDTVAELATTGDPVRIEFAPHAVTARGLRADLKHETLRLEAAVNGRFAR